MKMASSTFGSRTRLGTSGRRDPCASSDKRRVPWACDFTGRQRRWPNRRAAAPSCSCRPAAALARERAFVGGCGEVRSGEQAEIQAQLDVVGDRYLIGRELGRGSFGTVFEATDLHTGELVAVKKIATGGSNTSQRRKILEEVRFLREVQACAFVCQYHGLVQDDNSMYLIMELVDGPCLADVLAIRGRLTESEAAAALHDILQVVSHCHGSGICHSDIKPANFLLHSSHQPQKSEARWTEHKCLEQPKLSGLHIVECTLKAIDFGCSQQVSRKFPRLSHPKGTPIYSAPEVYERSYSSEADLWSCGMILCQLLTGQLPFWDSPHGLSKEQVCEGIMRAPLEFSSNEWAGVSQEARDLCERLLDRDRFRRISANNALAHPFIRKHTAGRFGSSWSTFMADPWNAKRQSDDYDDKSVELVLF